MLLQQEADYMWEPYSMAAVNRVGVHCFSAFSVLVIGGVGK
jgi:hypothetical protein